MHRPTSVTVFGLLNIVFGVFGIFGVLLSAALFFLPPGFNNTVVRAIQEQPGYAAWLKVCILLGLLSCALLLAAGIGLYRMQAWGRTLSIAYALYAIVFGIISAVVNSVFLVKPMLAAARDLSGPEAAGSLGGAIGGSVGGCLGLIYPVLLLIFMSRPSLRAALYPAKPPAL